MKLPEPDGAREIPQLEVLIGLVLKIGVIISTACLVAGVATALVHPGAGLTLLDVGLLVLIATPAARVVLSFIEYVIHRDWTFALLTAIVLAELFVSAVAALVFHRRL